MGRKLAQDGGKHVMAFFEMVKTLLEGTKATRASKATSSSRSKGASKDLQSAGMYFMQNGMKNPNDALAGLRLLMHMFGHVCLGLMWAQMAKAANDALAAGTDDPQFYENKLITGRYYMQRWLPTTKSHMARAMSGSTNVMGLDAEAF